MNSFYIPKPCHENWNTMTQQEKGRHCDVCSKVVVDFTKKSPVEVNTIMAQAEGSVCGNFNIDQLNKEAQMKVFKNPLNLFNRNFKYFAMSVFGFFAINKKSEAQMKGKVAIRGDVAPYEYDNTNKVITTLHGSILKHDGKPAGGSTIRLVSGGKEIGTTIAIANGSYSIKIQPGKIVDKKINVFVDNDYYESKSITDLAITKPENKLNITLDEMYMMLGEVAFVPQKIDTVKTIAIPDTAKSTNDEVIIAIKNIPVDTTTKTTCTETYTLLPVDTSSENTNKNQETPINNLVIRPEDITASIYPNPAGTYATVYCNKAANYKIELFDLKGALQQTVSFNGNQIKLDVSTFESGTYVVRVNDETGTVNSLKLVKK